MGYIGQHTGIYARIQGFMYVWMHAYVCLCIYAYVEGSRNIQGFLKDIQGCMTCYAEYVGFRF